VAAPGDGPPFVAATTIRMRPTEPDTERSER
jgi:hypothetical protein